MERRVLSTSEVHSYYFDLSKIDADKAVAAFCGTDDTEPKPVPAFEIPEELRMNGLKFAIPDGNHRWLRGHLTSGKVEAIVYAPGERLDVEAHGLAPFRNAENPKLYEKTIGVYCLQMGILDRMREAFESPEK